MNRKNFAWYGSLFGVVPILILSSTYECHAQPIGRSGGFVTPGSETWGGYVIPNVDNKLSLASLLYNRTVAESLGVNVEGRKLIHEYLANNGGSFKSKVVISQGNIPKTREQIHAETVAHRLQSEKFLDEIVSPSQWGRLRQMAYQVEVARMGLASALTQGRLGSDSGVHGQQTDTIRRTAEDAEARAKAEIVRILAEMQQEVLAELTPDQQQAAQKLLGEPFVFKEDLISSLRAGGGVVPGSEGEEGYVIPDVDNKLSLALLLNNRSLAQSLGLSPGSIGLINDYLVQNGKSFRSKPIARPRTADVLQTEMEAYRAQSEKFLDEIVSPSQWGRLRQMAYQVEVSRIGLTNALTEGKLGAEIGIEEEQNKLIRRQGEKAESRAKTQVVKVLMKMQEDVLAALTPAQRKEAHRLLGDPIVFKEELESSLRIKLPGFEENESKGE